MSIRPGDVLGPYTIERVLSKQGGMSQLLLAYETDRPPYKAAIKAHLTQSSNRLAYQDLLRHEVTILQELRHPGIVRVYPMRIDGKVVYAARAADRPDQPWYFAMEYLGADSLDKHLDRIVKKFPLVWSMELFYQLLTAIHFMHQSGYAHCDLKPHNILFRHPPNPSHTPDPVLVDFGSATSIAKGMDQLSFSLRYSPPEVLMAHRGDIPMERSHLPPDRIDVWALGAILFEVVVGKPLVNHNSLEKITTLVLRGKFEEMRSLRPEVDHSLDKLLTAMLRAEPGQRPDVKAVIQALEERIYSIRPPRIAS